MQRRNTVQRELILNAVISLKCHATADEVYSFVKARHPSVSRTTVYRNLHLLSEKGAIKRIRVPGEADRFDHNTFDHYHVLCLSCGRVFDVDVEAVRGMEERIKDAHGFVFFGCDIVFKGICPDCNADKEKQL